MRIIAALLLLSLPSLANAANDLSPKDFDFACAITAGAEMGVNPKDSEARAADFTLLTFYIGRLSARDDKTMWNAVILGRVAELREKARSADLFKSCMDFYLTKIQ